MKWELSQYFTVVNAATFVTDMLAGRANQDVKKDLPLSLKNGAPPPRKNIER